jgi:hypothetical protein
MYLLLLLGLLEKCFKKEQLLSWDTFVGYRKKLQNWIESNSLRKIIMSKKECNTYRHNVDILYYYHLLFYFALFVAVNEGIKIGYSDEEALEQLLLHELQGKRDIQELGSFIKELNSAFYNHQFYRILFNGKDILKEAQKHSKKISQICKNKKN